MILALLIVATAPVAEAQQGIYVTNITRLMARGDYCNQFDTGLRSYTNFRFPLYTSERTKGPSSADTLKFEPQSAVRSAVFTYWVDRLAGRSDSVTITIYGVNTAPGSRTPKWTQIATTTLSNTASSTYEYAFTGVAGIYYQKIYSVLTVGNAIVTASIKWQSNVWLQ
jgi:hypothetical protein